jgi:hypothetical protein
MAQYLLPCTCGQMVRVESAQAGGRAVCSCGKELAVPTLRGLKALEPAPLDQAAARRAAGRQWSRLQGWMFSVGVMLAVVSLGIIGFTLYRYVIFKPYSEDPSAQINETFSAQIDTMQPTDVLAEFTTHRDTGLGDPELPPWVQVQNVLAEQRTIMIAAGVATFIGLVTAAAALVMKPAARPA